MGLAQFVFLLATPALPPLPARAAPTTISSIPLVSLTVQLDFTKIPQTFSAQHAYLAAKLATLVLHALLAILAASTQEAVSLAVQHCNISNRLKTLLNAVACNASILVILAAMNPLV